MDQQDQDICQVVEPGPEPLHPDCVWHHHRSLCHGLWVVETDTDKYRDTQMNKAAHSAHIYQEPHSDRMMKQSWWKLRLS